MLEKQLWEPAGLTQRVPAADNCTEIAIAANKVMAEIKVNLRNFMLPPRCACLQSNGAGSVKPLGRREARGAAEAQVYAQSGFCQGFSPDGSVLIWILAAVLGLTIVSVWPTFYPVGKRGAI